jgi:archaellum biogenesis ATPase FlaH
MLFDSLSKNEQDANTKLVFERFVAQDTYAIRVESSGRAYYVPSTFVDPDNKKPNVAKAVKAALTKTGGTQYSEQVVRAHLAGEVFVGVYPIRKDSTVTWFALDFDGEELSEALQHARDQQLVLKDAGLPTYLERSQSGKGVHLWGFLDGPVPAGHIRHALSPFIERVETYDRMFPNQDEVSEFRPLGNLIALPLHGSRAEQGCSVFLDETGDPFADQWDFLQNVSLIPVATVRSLFEKAGQYQIGRQVTSYRGASETRKDSWKMTHRIFGSSFIRYCWDEAENIPEPVWYALACQFAQFEDGRNLFHQWSQQDARRYNAPHTDRKYDQAVEKNKPHSCEAIRNLGAPCDDDSRFDGVYHPFDLSEVLFVDLIRDLGYETDSEQTVDTAQQGFSKVRDWLRTVEKDPTIGRGYKFDIEDLDETCGLRDGNMVVIAARPSRGKSAMINHIANSVAEQGAATLVFSLEMTSKEFWARQLSTRTDISGTKMKSGTLTADDWAKIDSWLDELNDPARYPVFVDEWSRDMTRMYEVAGRLHHEQKGKLVIILDYLQIVQSDTTEDQRTKVGRASAMAKHLAKVLHIPVVVLAQLNREAEGQGVEAESLDSWLKDSGNIEQDADVIIFILGEKGPGVVERTFVLQKDRHGTAGVRFTIDFNQPLMQFGPRGTWLVPQSYASLDNDLPTVSPDDPDLFAGYESKTVVDKGRLFISEFVPKGQEATVDWTL